MGLGGRNRTTLTPGRIEKTVAYPCTTAQGVLAHLSALSYCCWSSYPGGLAGFFRKRIHRFMQIQDRSQEQDAVSASSRKRSLETHGLYRLGLAYGRQVYRFRWFIIVLWIIILGVSIPFAGQITSVLQGGGYSFKNKIGRAHV